MFIKLTKLDGSPIWINASFVVTVESRKGGGSIVVPIGDGLDYDVKEPTATVLELLGAAPAPAVVPVPAPKMLAPTHENIELSPDVPEAKPEAAAPATPSAAVPAADPSAAEGASVVEVAPEERKPARAKRAVRGRTRAKAAPAALDAEQVARLRKMAPGSLRKLVNTLSSQFKIADPDAAVKALVAGNVLALEQDHVIWKQPEA